MKKEIGIIEFDNALYQTGLYSAYSVYHKDPFEITSIRNNMAIGWVKDVAYHASLSDVYLLKNPRKVWIHIIESTDGTLTPRLTEYQEYNPYKGNIIVKQFEVEV